MPHFPFENAKLKTNKANGSFFFFFKAREQMKVSNLTMNLGETKQFLFSLKSILVIKTAQIMKVVLYFRKDF